jgi:serine/threonine-protein kinase
MEPTTTENYTCPRCQAVATRARIAENRYLCPHCSLELAHLDIAPNGTVRKVVGWLLTPGTVVHERYRITGILGKGGFAATYLVRDTLLNSNKARALKEIPSSQHDDHETDLLSRLDHPAIPDIMDRFELGEMNYLVLKFGGSRTLEMERRKEGGTVAVATLLRWMAQLCDVLAYLHGQTPPVVHRDLKPDNILLDERDHIMLIDFGIAKESDGFAETRPLARSASYGFSPPEQMMSTGTDQRSDVYSLGATMYALLTGTIPVPAHERVAGVELKAAHELNSAIPPILDAAIMQALELNVNRRQQSIGELLQTLDSSAWTSDGSGPDFSTGPKTVRVDRNQGGPATSPSGPVVKPRPQVRKVPIAIGVGAALALVVGFGVWLSIGNSNDGRSKKDVATPTDPPGEVPKPNPPPEETSGSRAAEQAMREERDRIRREEEENQARVVRVPVAPPPAAPAPVKAPPPVKVPTPQSARAADEEPKFPIIYKGTRRIN